MNATQQKKKAALIAFNMRPVMATIEADRIPEIMARKTKMNAMLEFATAEFWALDKHSAFQIWFAASNDDCRAFAQSLNEEIAACFR